MGAYGTYSGGRGGRAKGSVNKLSREAVEKAKQEGLLPHEWLLKVARGEPIEHIYKNPKTHCMERQDLYPDLETRINAAKAAAPYFAPKMVAQEITGADGGPLQVENVSQLTEQETADRVAAILERRGKNNA